MERAAALLVLTGSLVADTVLAETCEVPGLLLNATTPSVLDALAAVAPAQVQVMTPESPI